MARRKNTDSETGPTAKVARRRSPSAYNIFVKSSWDKLNKKENYSNFLKECSQKWALMTEEQKKTFKEEAATLKDRTDEEKKSQVKAKDGGAKKKRPPGPYLIFCSEFREKVKNDNPTWALTEVSKELGRKWNALSRAEKEKYHAAANVEKEKYLKSNKTEDNKQNTAEGNGSDS